MYRNKYAHLGWTAWAWNSTRPEPAKSSGSSPRSSRCPSPSSRLTVTSNTIFHFPFLRWDSFKRLSVCILGNGGDQDQIHLKSSFWWCKAALACLINNEGRKIFLLRWFVVNPNGLLHASKALRIWPQSRVNGSKLWKDLISVRKELSRAKYLRTYFCY